MSDLLEHYACLTKKVAEEVRMKESLFNQAIGILVRVRDDSASHDLNPLLLESINLFLKEIQPKRVDEGTGDNLD